MDKKIKALIIGGAVLVVLVGALVALVLLNPAGGEASSSSSSSSAITVLEKNISNLDNVVVKNAKGEITVRRSADDSYTIDALKTLPVDQTDAKNVFSRTAVVEALKVIKENPEDLAEYGLDNPKTTITANMKDGSSYHIYLGILSPLGDGYYCMVEGDPKLYLVGTAEMDLFSNYANKDFVYRTFTSNTESAEIEALVQKVELYRSDLGRKLVFEQLTNDPDAVYRPTYASAFTMISPIKAYVDGENFYNVAGPATSMRADSVVTIFPTADQLKEYGFDNPQAVYSAVKTDGTTVNVKVGKDCFGDPAKENAEPSTEVTGYYIMVDGIDAVFYIQAYSLSFMDVSEFAVLSQIAFGPDIYKLESFTIEAQGKTYQFDLTQTQVNENRTEASGTLNGVKLDDAQLSNFYVYVVSALAEGLYTEKPTGDPVLTYTFRSLEEGVEPLVVEFHDIGDRKASITINGQTRFSTRMAYVTTFMSNIEALQNGGTINYNY